MAARSYSSSGGGALSRRDLLRLSAAGVAAYSASGWLEVLAADAAANSQRRRSCILLWMSGGPSQMDTFDLKPGHPNGGSFRPAQTAVPGVRICEHLPKLASQAQRLAIINSMSTKEGDHGRATFLLRTGYLPQSTIHYPALGSLVAKELGDAGTELPNFVSIGAERALSPAAFGPGFLGSQYAPLFVANSNYTAPGQVNNDEKLTVEDLAPPAGIARQTIDDRLTLLESLNTRFAGLHRSAAADSHRTAYERAVRLMHSKASGAFDLDEEPSTVRDAYGRNRFGQGCLLARRLVERGVPFIEVTLGGWDTHADNFDGVRQLCGILDPAWSMLMRELDERGLLDTTLIVWMGEFGRTPRINENSGRDHYPQAWSTVLAGGGIRGGQVVGRTSADGTNVEERPVTVPDFLATVCHGLGIDPTRQNASNVGRPIRIVDPAAKPIREVLV